MTILKTMNKYFTKKINNEKILVCLFDSLKERSFSKIEKSFLNKKIGEFQSLPEFLLIKSLYADDPLLLDDYNNSIIFDVYEITELELEKLNHIYKFRGLNNVNNINNRKKIKTPFGEAYVFVTNLTELKCVKVIESGDWIDFSECHTIIKSPVININKK